MKETTEFYDSITQVTVQEGWVTIESPYGKELALCVKKLPKALKSLIN